MKIALIGTGNVATHLGPSLKKAGHDIVCVYSRSKISAEKLGKMLKARSVISSDDIPGGADLYIVSISDHAIRLFLKTFPHRNKTIVHTSGSVSGKVFGSSFSNYGILYPLQTFSKKRKINFKKVPLFIEANNPATLAVIKKAAASISSSVTEMNSADRKVVHLAAVIVNNFSNHLFIMAEKLLKKKNISFQLLAPLLKETVEKAIAVSPINAQTGPAKRGDAEIIDEHLKMLEKEPRLKQIYRLLTQSIEETSGAQL